MRQTQFALTDPSGLPRDLCRARGRKYANRSYGFAPLNFSGVAPFTVPICALSLTFSTTS